MMTIFYIPQYYPPKQKRGSCRLHALKDGGTKPEFLITGTMFGGSKFLAWSLCLRNKSTAGKRWQWGYRNKVRIFGKYQNTGGEPIQSLSKRAIFHISEPF